MATEAQIEANRRNALKSTGPKTAEGKAKARRNSLKHGFRAGIDALSKEGEAKLDKAVARWKDELRPEGGAEDALVRLGAWSGAQLEALAKQHAAIVRKQGRDARRRFENKRIAEGEKTIAAFLKAEEPALWLEDLAENATACAWVVQEWNELIAEFVAESAFDEPFVARVERLLHLDPSAPPAFRDAAERLSGEIEADFRLAQVETRQVLLKIMQDCLESWIDRQERVWEEVERPLLEEAEALALSPLGKAGDRWLRYQGAHAGQLHRSISALLRIRTFDNSPRPADFQGRGGGPPPSEKRAPNEPNFSTQPLGFQMSSVAKPKSAEPVSPPVDPASSALVSAPAPALVSAPAPAPALVSSGEVEAKCEAGSKRPAGSALEAIDSDKAFKKAAKAVELAALQAEARRVFEASERRKAAERLAFRAPNEPNFSSINPLKQTSYVHQAQGAGRVWNAVWAGLVWFVVGFAVLRTTLTRVWSIGSNRPPVSGRVRQVSTKPIAHAQPPLPSP